MNPIELTLLDLAAQSDGVVSRRDLEHAGASRRQVERMLTQGLLTRVTPAVFLVRGYADSWSRRLRAAHVQAGPSSAISHASAAVLLEWPRIGPGAIEVTIPRGVAAPRSTVGRVHVSRRPEADGLVRVAGLPVTSVVRTLLDLAPRLATGHLAACVIDCCHRGLTTLPDLTSNLAELRGRGVAGGPRLDRVLAGCDDVPKADSFLEAKFLAILREHGFPAPRTQVPIRVDGHEYRVDALWEVCKFIVELNGYGTHASRTQLATDAARAARLQSAGYELVVFTYDQVMDDPRFVLAQVGLRLRRSTVA